MSFKCFFSVRPMETHDVGAILAIQYACYPANLIESPEALLSKRRLSPQSCWLAEENGHALGYLFTHPWHDTTPPALDKVLPGLPENSDTFFLHDLAIHPTARSRGVAQALLQQAMEWAKAHRYRKAMLVAVQDSHSFWQRHGFALKQGTSAALHEKLLAYGEGAACLVASIG